MKVMLNGTDSLWRLWLGFFREHFAAILSLVVLLPLAFYINWRLAILLFALCVVFTVLTTMVVRKTYGMQSEVEAHYSDLSARASDALGNVALVQSFVRIDAEVQGLRFVADKLLAVQMPVLGWWAIVTVITRASTTITVLAIFTVGIYLHGERQTTVGEIVMFVSFATMLIQKLEQVVSFINSVFMEAPRLQEFFPTPWTPDGSPASSNSTTSRFPMTASGPRSRTFRLPPCPARPSPWSARPAPANRPRSRCCTAPSIRNPASSRSTAWTSAA
jgi:ATP-binding cassette subfamily B protein